MIIDDKNVNYVFFLVFLYMTKKKNKLLVSTIINWNILLIDVVI